MNDSNEQIFDIYDVWYEPLLTQTWFIVTLIICLSIIVSIVLYLIYIKYSRRVTIVHPFVEIEKNLQSLSKVHIKNEQDCKKVFFEVTTIMKKYLSYRYNTSVIGLTDKEVVEWAYQIVPEGEINILKQLLLDVTSIKFEHQIVTTQQLQEYIVLMQDFIKKTTPEKKLHKES